MKKIVSTLCLSAVLSAATVHAAVIAGYNFNTDLSPTTTLTGVTATDMATVNGVNETGGNFDIGRSTALGGHVYLRSVATGGNQAAALADDDYFSFTISANEPGQVMNLTSLVFDALASSKVANFNYTLYLQSSAGGLGTDGAVIDSQSFNLSTNTNGSAVVIQAGQSFDLSGPAFQGLSSITFQLRVSDDGSTTDEIARLDNIQITGDLVPIPEPSSLLMLGGLGALLLRRRRQ